MNRKITSLGGAIKETLLSEPVGALAFEYAEIGLDAVLTDEVLKEIPFVNSLVSLTKIGLTISDRLLVNKLIKFMSNLNDVPPAERVEMVARLERDPKFGSKVGEQILELLTRVEGKKKPKMLAQVFSAYSKSKIDVRTLMRLNYAIEQVPGTELDNIRPFHNRSEENPFSFDTYTGQVLVVAGLAEMHSAFGGITFKPSELCQIFLDLNLDR